jgi:phenylalanyl-tRNA synthetase beta chain
MKVTYSWLKDFVDIKISARALADKLTMAGLEITSLEARDGDFIFEIEVTSNRPDCLSVIGIAREAAAITNSKLKTQNSEPKFKIQKSKQETDSLKILVENTKDCPLYTAKIIRDVKVQASPDWLRKKLELVGCRSVNNIVDITNYCLFTWGEPLHAFDLDKLKQDAVFVRRAKKGEKIITLDGQTRILTSDILVIADKERPIALAGVMGGQDTEVVSSAKNILLEAAVFNPIIVRRARQALGIASESAYRFERGVDLESVEQASWQAVKLIQELAGGRCIWEKATGLTKTKRKTINLKPQTANKILGMSIAPAKIKKILDNLGFKLKGKNNFIVEVPSCRPDVNLEIDLIEEIARIAGYESIPNTTPKVTPQITSQDTGGLISSIKNVLVGLGLNEVITYSLINKDLLKGLGSNKEYAIEIGNPLSKEQEILRPTILTGLIKSIAYNLNQKQDWVNLFEIAKVFFQAEDSGIKEELRIGIALCGVKSRLLEQGKIRERAGLLHLKGILEVLFERLDIKDYNFTPDNTGQMSVYAAKEKIGVMMRLPKSVLDTFDIKNKDVFTLELALDKVLSHTQINKRFVDLPKYPGITRDISFIVKGGISIKDILGLMRERASPLLRDLEISDYYQGKQIPAGYRGLTISCLYRSDERTLTETEINPLHGQISAALEERFGAKMR